MSNRYAFFLLEILSLSNKVELVHGAHYPTVHKPLEERDRRWGMISRWGLTELEECLKYDENAVLDARDQKENNQIQQRRILQQQEREAIRKTVGNFGLSSEEYDERSHTRSGGQQRKTLTTKTVSFDEDEWGPAAT